MDAQENFGCEQDERHLHTYHAEFNDWLENDEAGWRLLDQSTRTPQR